MSDLRIEGLTELKGRDPLTYRVIKQLLDSHNGLAQQLNGNPSGSEVAAPEAHASNSIIGGAGMVDIKITNNSPQFRGQENFADFKPVGGSWEQAQTVHIGATNNFRGVVGTGQFEMRTYAQYPNSPPSDFTYHPTVVDTTGSAQPTMQSGDGRVGYGQTPILNSVTVPKRQ